jgi:hypothetical protein
VIPNNLVLRICLRSRRKGFSFRCLEVWLFFGPVLLPLVYRVDVYAIGRDAPEHISLRFILTISRHNVVPHFGGLSSRNLDGVFHWSNVQQIEEAVDPSLHWSYRKGAHGSQGIED